MIWIGRQKGRRSAALSAGGAHGGGNQSQREARNHGGGNQSPLSSPPHILFFKFFQILLRIIFFDVKGERKNLFSKKVKIKIEKEFFVPLHRKKNYAKIKFEKFEKSTIPLRRIFLSVASEKKIATLRNLSLKRSPLLSARTLIIGVELSIFVQFA